jgi:predicted DNA-binding protein YlxM (UPF0122 family)
MIKELIKMNKKLLKKEILMFYREGKSVNQISDFFSISKSTVYRYINNYYDDIVFSILEKKIKLILISGNLKSFISKLNYSDICLLVRKLELTGYNKKTKLNSIYHHFKRYSLLGFYKYNLQLIY